MLAKRLAGWVVSHPVAVLTVMLSISVTLMYYAYSGLSLRILLEEMLPVDRQNVQLIQKFGSQFGGANTTLIAIENQHGSIYEQDFLEKYKHISDEIYFHPDAIRHLIQSLSLRKTKAVSGSGGRIQIDAVMWPTIPASQLEMDTLRSGVRAQYRGVLVSDDEKSAMIVADFKDEADYEALVDFINVLRADVETGDIKMYAAGRPILLGTIYKALDNTVLILGASVALVALILLAYFHHWIGVFVPILSASTATVWGIGVMGLTNYNLDPLLILLPAFIFAIVLSHSVQFISRVFEEFNEHHHMREAVRHGLAKLMFPSMAAIVTDAAGFTVLVLVGIPSIQALALICTVWLLSIGPALIFSAALLCLLPRPKSYRMGLHVIEKIWSALKLERHSLTVVIISVLLFVIGLVGSRNLTIGDAVGSPILWPDSRYNLDNDAINQRFSGLGTDMMQVYIEGDDNTMLDPVVYHNIEALDRHVYQQVEQASPAQSLVPVIKKINEVLYEGDPSYAIIPDSTEEIGFNIYLFRSKGEPGDFAAYTNPEWQIGSISIPVKDHAGPTVDHIVNVVDDFINAMPAFEGQAQFLQAGGQIGITKAVNDEIRSSNSTLFISIVLVIAFCVLILYRSITVALILIFSLATANFLTYFFMASRGIGLSINTLPLTALGIGLGVDYGIYMIDRIREECRTGCDLFSGVKRSIQTSGNAIFVTAMTMVLPLIPWFLFSSLRFQAEMGMLLGLVLFLNMIGSIVLVPALVLVLKPRVLLPAAGELERQDNQLSEPDTGSASDNDASVPDKNYGKNAINFSGEALTD